MVYNLENWMRFRLRVAPGRVRGHGILKSRIFLNKLYTINYNIQILQKKKIIYMTIIPDT